MARRKLFGLRPQGLRWLLLVVGLSLVHAQDQNFYYAGPQARFLPSNYQQSQHDFLQQQDHPQSYRQQQPPPGFQQLESYFPAHRDLQTSDLPVHLQQTLPQYRFNGPKGTAGSFQHVQHFPATGAQPAPFRPQHSLTPSVPPSTHRPNYAHLFNKNHNADTEMFLGQITIESPAELPPEFNNSPFKPSLDFPGGRRKVDKRPVSQNLDESNRNTISLGGGPSFLSQRTRIFAPTRENDFKNKPQVKDYFVNVNGDVYATGKAARSTTPYPITTLIRKDRYNPLLYKPTSETPNFENISRGRKPVTPHTFDLESLLEDPIDDTNRDKQSDHVEVIQSVTVAPNHFYTLAPSNQTWDISSTEDAEEEYEEDEEDTESPEYEYDTTEDATETSTGDRLVAALELHENENNVSDISDNSLRNKDQDKGYDVLTMKPSTMVKDDNFKGFIDSTVIDNTSSEEPNTTTKSVDASSEANQIEPRVSVVTTKSVINSTIIGSVTPAPKPILQLQVTSPVTTIDDASESWVVVASVQTSRSVSGARYLPSSIVEQEERTKLLLNEHSEEETTEESTTTALPDPPPAPATGKTKTSTESLIDKLDRVQSDLSSGLLSDGFKPSGNNIAVLTENNMPEKGETTVLDMDGMTTPGITTTAPRADGPPVVIKKFMPNARPTFKPKFQTRPKSTVQPNPDTQADLQNDEPIKANNDTLQKPVIALDIRKFLPAGYTRPPNLKETQPKTIADILNVKTTPKPQPVKSLVDDWIESVKIADISALLPAGYKLPPETATNLPEIETTELESATTIAPAAKPKKPTPIAIKDDISALLPPGYQFEETTTAAAITVVPKPENNTSPGPKDKLGVKKTIQVDDISAFLPPGYKNFKKTITTTTAAAPTAVVVASPKNSTKSKLDTKFELLDISKFLPPGYKPRSTTTRKPPISEAPTATTSLSPRPEVSNTSTQVTVTTTKSSFKVVFPSRPGGAVRKSSGGRLTTPKYSEDGVASDKPSAVTAPTIHKGWPSRATTEFTGWPTPSTTPISIERLLERAREAAAAAAAAASSTEESPSALTTASTTTSTTSTTTQQPTTPGLCRGECDLAGTIKLVGGAKWVPELLDRNTKEWQILANEVQGQLEDVYSKSSVLNKWYKRIRIDGFSEGSVLVDYLVELNDLGAQVDTLTIRKLFHDSLVEESKATPASNREPKASDLDLDEDNQEDDDNSTTTLVEGPRLGLGNFIVDPTFTDFIVIPKQIQVTPGYADENVLLPQWAIAVIVIGLASLLFVIIFGVTVLVNRQKSAKKKQPTPLSEDMLQELNKNHMSGIDNYGAEDLYNMEDVWNDRHPYDTKIPKKRSTGSIHGDNSMANLYDSWKSEWNGYYYNAYYGNPHQQPGGSSTHSGPAYGHHQYSGRRRSDYDTNF